MVELRIDGNKVEAGRLRCFACIAARMMFLNIISCMHKI